MKNYPTEKTSIGNIKYHEDVLKTTIHLALAEIEGVISSENHGGGGILGKKNVSHINNIIAEQEKVTIELSIVVQYGLPLREKAQEVQQKIGAAISDMIGLTVEAVHVTVAGVEMED